MRDVLKGKPGGLTERLAAGARMVPLLLKKPAVALHWVRSARLAQATIIVLALMVPTVITGSVDSILEKRYPPLIHEEILGLVKKSYDNPRLAEKKDQARAVLWVSSGTLVVMLLLLHLPVAVKSADKRAKEREEQADSLLRSDPGKSLHLYRLSLNLATDAAHIESIRNKLRAAGERDISSHDQGRDKTVVLSPSGLEQEQGGGDDGNLRVGAEGRYRIAGTLGQGAMGITHRARDEILERDVALKELHPRLASDAGFASRFRQEAKVLARLTHPGIVQVYDFIEESGRIWIVMELVRGGELADLLRERGSLSVAETVRLGMQMAEAMGYAHARGVVHRDFKPSNVMLTAGGIPKITDFGLAVVSRSAKDSPEGEVAGSPFYMSPEQAAGATADARSDIYSMGAVLYQMLSGKVPFDGGDFEKVLDRHRRDDPLPLSRVLTGIPEGLDSLILSMLAKNPDRRVQDMMGVAGALKKYAVAPEKTKTM